MTEKEYFTDSEILELIVRHFEHQSKCFSCVINHFSSRTSQYQNFEYIEKLLGAAKEECELSLEIIQDIIDNPQDYYKKYHVPNHETVKAIQEVEKAWPEYKENG
jgi:hypothetical protein